MSALAARESISVGLIGGSPNGWHLIESMTGGGPFRVALVHEPDDALAAASTSFNIPIVANVASLLHANSVDVLWLARTTDWSSNFVDELLLSGKPIITELPEGPRLEHFESLVMTAIARGVSLYPHCPRRADRSFRNALAAVRSGQLGQLLAAKWVSWNYGLAPAGATGSATAPPLFRLLAHSLDQLLLLHAANSTRVETFGDLRSSIQVVIEFSDGSRGEIDWRIDSPVQLTTGWLLTGDRGGFAAGRCSSLAPDGEVFDSPRPAGDESVDRYSELAQQLRAGDRNECRHLLAFTRLLQTIASATSQSSATI